MFRVPLRFIAVISLYFSFIFQQRKGNKLIHILFFYQIFLIFKLSGSYTELYII